MSWRVKLWFFNSGSAAILAVAFAGAGNALCFVFGLIAAIDWYIGNVMLERTKEGE